MPAYHNDPAIKSAILIELEAHRDADDFVKGRYWENGKGCAVGCTIKSGNHAEYETRFGIPEMLALLEDCIFKGLPNDKAKEWPIRFMSAVEPGRELSLVGWKFLHWLLTDETVNPGINHPLVKDAVAGAAQVVYAISQGAPPEESTARSAVSEAWSAASAAWSAGSAARSAARSAAWSAWSAASAAWSATSAAVSAAWSAANAASAAWSAAVSAAWSAESAAYCRMSDVLIDLIEAAPSSNLEGLGGDL